MEKVRIRFASRGMRQSNAPQRFALTAPDFAHTLKARTIRQTLPPQSFIQIVTGQLLDATSQDFLDLEFLGGWRGRLYSYLAGGMHSPRIGRSIRAGNQADDLKRHRCGIDGRKDALHR